MSELIFIGTIVGLKGLDGTLKVETADFYELKSGSKVFVGFSKVYSEEFIVETWKSKIRRYAYLKLKGVNTIAQAKTFLEKGIFAPSQLMSGFLSPLDLTKFKDFTLVNSESGDEIGKVVGIQSNPGNDLLVVNIHGTEILVPFVDEFIIEIDKEKNTIYIKCIDGLLDIRL